MDFSDEEKADLWRGRKNIRHEYELPNIIFVIRQQLGAMDELRWDKKTFTRVEYVKYIKLRMP